MQEEYHPFECLTLSQLDESLIVNRKQHESIDSHSDILFECLCPFLSGTKFTHDQRFQIKIAVEEMVQSNGYIRILRSQIDLEVKEAKTKAVKATLALISEAGSNKPSLTVDCIAQASGIALEGNGRHQTNLASKHGVTKQAVSKRQIRVTEMLGLRPSENMRSEETRNSYRKFHLDKISKIKQKLSSHINPKS